MLDAMSYYPGPSRDGGIFEIYSDIKISLNIKSSNMLERIITDQVDNQIKLFGSLGSQTGWMVCAKKEILTYSIQTYTKKKIQLKNKFKLYATIIGRLMVQLHKSIENVYKPGGVYETTTSNNSRWCTNPLSSQFMESDTNSDYDDYSTLESNTSHSSISIQPLSPNSPVSSLNSSESLSSHPLPPPPPLPSSSLQSLSSPYYHRGKCKIQINDEKYEYINKEEERYNCLLCWKYICTNCNLRSNYSTNCPHCYNN